MKPTATGQRKMNAASRELFPVKGSALTVETDLYWELLEEFSLACDKLLESRKQNLAIDLRSVNFISSNFVGCLTNLVLRAARKRKFLVLKVSEDVNWLFEIMGAQKHLTLEVV